MRNTAAAERREIGGGTTGFFRCEALSVIYCLILCCVVDISFFQERMVDYPYHTLGFLQVCHIVCPEGQLSRGRFSIIGLRNGISKRNKRFGRGIHYRRRHKPSLALARLPSNDSCIR